MDVRVFVSRKSDVADLARFFRFQQGGIRAFLIEDPIGVFVAQNFVVLDEVDVVGLQAL